MTNAHSTPRLPPFLSARLAVEALTLPRTKATYAYWRAIAGDRPMPSRKDIQPTDIPQLLSHIALVDVLYENPVDYFFRIEGDALQRAIGYRRMGQRLSQLVEQLGPLYPGTVDWMDAARLAAMPSASRSGVSGSHRRFYAIEVVMLPLSNDGRRVDHFLVCVEPLEPVDE